jgi:hypothetical protein
MVETIASLRLKSVKKRAFGVKSALFGVKKG